MLKKNSTEYQGKKVWNNKRMECKRRIWNVKKEVYKMLRNKRIEYK